MARKKRTEVPPAAESKPKPRTGDRHRPRRTVNLPPELYDQLAVLADRNGRPLNWEIRRALQEHLRQNGLWPPPAGGED
jgi:hypothetical protein